ncbi:MAG: AAA family ATPase [Planctomycetaceae bacterium]
MSQDGWLLRSMMEQVTEAGFVVSQSLQKTPPKDSPQAQPYYPKAPGSLRETGLPEQLLSGIVLKYLCHVGKAAGRDIARQTKLPFRVLEDLLKTLRDEQTISYVRSAGVGDFEYLLTEQGRIQAIQLMEQSTYFGAAPVPLQDYVHSVKQQALSRVKVTPSQVEKAFDGLMFGSQVVRRVGQALTGGATMLLFGNPGNGKSSIAERLIKPFNDTVWIPRALHIDGDVIRVYDPAVHIAAPATDSTMFDERWVRIERPIVMVGGELTLDALELQFNSASNTYEAPVQMKSNCGVLLIDDFGRQKVDPEHILNRWIVPLEKKVDYLDLSNGKRVCVPFEQMLVFSTNLRPADVVDEAFLRRITYKVEVPDPTEEQFRDVFWTVARTLKLSMTEEGLEDLIHRHYRLPRRPMRFCHPRDLLQQVAIACDYADEPRTLTPTLVDDAVLNYFCATPSG